jgi:hypothetical protein
MAAPQRISRGFHRVSGTSKPTPFPSCGYGYHRPYYGYGYHRPYYYGYGYPRPYYGYGYGRRWRY